MTTPEQPEPAADHENAPPPTVDTAHPAEPPPPTAPPTAGEPRRRRFTGARTVVRHRATHLIAVMVLGLAIGAGVTALVTHGEGSDGGGGDHREHSRRHDNRDQQDQERER